MGRKPTKNLPKAYRSPLRKHRDAIRKWRQADLTWAQVAAKLKDEFGIERTPQAIHQFFKRSAERPYALGTEPDPSGLEALPAPGRTKPPAPVDPPPTGVNLNDPDLLEPTPKDPFYQWKLKRQQQLPNP